MRNLENIIIASAIFFRILIAIPMVFVSIEKFSFLGHWVSLIVGIGSIVAFEFMLILLSVSNNRFRQLEMEDIANFFLLLAIMLGGFASFILQNLNDFYTVKFPYSTFIPLHSINFVSILLLESVGFWHVRLKELAEHAKRMEQHRIDHETKKAKEQISKDSMVIEINSTNIEHHSTDNETVESLLAAGMPVKLVAERLGLGISTVYKKRNELQN